MWSERTEFCLDQLLYDYLGQVPQDADPCIDPQSAGNFSRVRNIYIDRGSALEVLGTLSTVRSAISQRRTTIREETEEKQQLSLADTWLHALSVLCMGTIEEDDITRERLQLVIQLLWAALPNCRADRDADYFLNAIKECGGTLPPPIPSSSSRDLPAAAAQPPPLPQASNSLEKGKLDELIKAAEQSDLGAINRALDTGIDVNGTDNEGWTALGTAASFGTLKAVQLLLSRGANVDGRHGDGRTPVFRAAASGSLEIARLLVERGADVNAQDSEGHVPLNPALTSRKSEAHMQIIELFLAKGARTDLKDESGLTPLHQAARNNHVRGAQLLLKAGADVNARTADQKTPLYLHREEGEGGEEDRAMEELLLSAGATAPGYQATISHDRATGLCADDSYEEAIHYFDQALAEGPLPSLLPDIWYNKGCALDELGRLEEAIACYDRAFELDPRAADALNRMGVALGKLGDGDKQLVCFQKAVVADPKNTNSWSYLGGALSKRGKHREALACCNKLLALNSEDATAWYNKGIALANLGIDAEALDCHDRACELDPSLEISLADPGAQAIEDFYKRIVRPRRNSPS